MKDELYDPDEDAGPVRLHVIEPNAEVAIEAERQTDGLASSCRDPVPLPSELVPGSGSVGPLDDRTLHGCRLGDSPKAVDSTFDVDANC